MKQVLFSKWIISTLLVFATLPCAAHADDESIYEQETYTYNDYAPSSAPSDSADRFGFVKEHKKKNTLHVTAHKSTASKAPDLDAEMLPAPSDSAARGPSSVVVKNETSASDDDAGLIVSLRKSNK